MKTQIHEESDGITKRSRPTFIFDGSPNSKADVKAFMAEMNAHLRACGFEGKIAELEAWLLTIPHTEGARYGTKAWYAGEVLKAIAGVREARALGAMDLALAGAVDVGAKWAEMSAKGWRIVLKGRKIRRGSKTGARHRGDEITDTAKDDDAAIYQLADKYSGPAKPKTRMYRSIARDLLSEFGISKKPDTIRKRLDLRQID